MENHSTAPNWTIVFATIHPSQLAYVLGIIDAAGYQYDMWQWAKPNLYGAAHAGGARQAVASEIIVSAYKFDPRNRKNSLEKHYALLSRQAQQTVRIILLL
jgi:hypothetical protein